MKYDIEKLRKVDFSRWNNEAWKAKIQHGKVYLELSNSLSATRCPVEGWTLFVGHEALVRETLVKIELIDAFITSELRRIEHEEYDVGDGWERVKDGEKFDEMLNLDASPTRWVKIDEMCLPTLGDRLVFRRRKAPQVKLPTVKAPEGCWWVIDNGRVGIRGDGAGACWFIPTDRKVRDKYAALAAAFDEANGVQSVEFETNMFDYSTSIHEPSGTLTIKGVGLTRFTEGIASKFPNGFTVKVTARP